MRRKGHGHAPSHQKPFDDFGDLDENDFGDFGKGNGMVRSDRRPVGLIGSDVFRSNDRSGCVPDRTADIQNIQNMNAIRRDHHHDRRRSDVFRSPIGSDVFRSDKGIIVGRSA